MKKLNAFTEKHFTKVIYTCATLCVFGIMILALIVNTDAVSGQLRNGFRDKFIDKAATELSISGEQTVNTIIADIGKLDPTTDIDAYIAEKERLLEQLLKEYNDLLVSNQMSEAELNEIKSVIDAIFTTLLEDNKVKIKQAYDAYMEELSK